MPALRAAVFAANRLPIIVSKVLPHRRAAWWKRWLLQRPRHILVASEGEADLARRLDLDANRIVICPPAVEIAEAEHVRAVGSDLDGCLVVAFGTERFASCGKVAVWAFDLVRHVEPMLRLALVGRCRERDRIAEFISQVTEASRVEFAESSEAHSKCLAQAKVAWVFAARNDGMDRLAEAWAAGLPVVTSDMPELAGRVRHEIDVLQVAANDPVALGRATRRLLDDPDLRHRLAEAGRERARRDFDPVRLAGCVARVYEIP
jgi:glycosyltransferase involved in cell wall biosynthesis